MSVADTAPPVQALGFTFTETMGGFLSAGAMGYRSGYARGQRAGEDLRFTLTVTADDLSRFVREPQHSAVLTGSVEGYWVGGTAAIEPGPFNLFARDRRGRRQMRYHFLFPGREGVRYVLDGFKDVHNDYVFDGWKDTTTLFTTLRREDAPGGPPTALGILKIRPLDLVPQVWSMRGVNARGLVDHLRALARFNLFFAGEMVREYTPRPFAARERDAAPGE
jgi:cholesterol oxidase